ncbi:MAG: RimK/LysX family protein [Rubricoccaceae bacterium]|nr:RimK/LysX family protein [Rubricoccaceae bacterium]
MSSPITVGWREWVALPGLELFALEAKMDTGAMTSSLHAVEIDVVDRAGGRWVHFRTHPIPIDNPAFSVACKAPLVDKRVVTVSNGVAEARFVIAVDFRLGLSAEAPVWPIQLTLADRSAMQMPLLIGREALANRVLVSSSAEYTLGDLETPDDFYPS